MPTSSAQAGVDPAVLTTRPGRWIDRWEPEDPEFWRRHGRRIANRNLWFSVFVEHVGFSVWTLWSVFVLFLGPEYGIDAAGKFFLVSTPALVGAAPRVPYTLAVARFGGRNWTVTSGLLLLGPTAAAAFVLHPGTSYSTFVLVAALAGVGGGNFASSMANINTFFPESGRSPLQAIAVTFVGPPLSSLVRPLGGWTSDRVGGATVTFWTFLGFYLVCLVLTWSCYLRRPAGHLVRR